MFINQVKRLEILLGKCKDTIKNNKERIKQLTTDREELQRHLEERDSVINSMKVCENGEFYLVSMGQCDSFHVWGGGVRSEVK